LSNTKLNSCGDFILSIIQILGWTPHLQTGIILKVLFGLFTTLGFNCRKSYVDDFPIPNAISFATQFNANITKKWDTIMSYLIVSPDMHKVHHHYKLPYTDSNYGNIFSVWDRLGHSEHFPKKKLYSIDTHMRIEEHNELNLLKIPFQ
jgi:hypothetical protein